MENVSYYLRKESKWDVGAYTKEAIVIIAKAGFEKITVFQNREPRFVTIAKGEFE